MRNLEPVYGLINLDKIRSRTKLLDFLSNNILAGMEGLLIRHPLTQSPPINRLWRDIASLFRLFILARVNSSIISLRFTEPRDVLLCKTGGSNHYSSKRKSSRSDDLELFPWLGWRDSNPRMLGPEPSALPLGDIPIGLVEIVPLVPVKLKSFACLD